VRAGGGTAHLRATVGIPGMDLRPGLVRMNCDVDVRDLLDWRGFRKRAESFRIVFLDAIVHLISLEFHLLHLECLRLKLHMMFIQIVLSIYLPRINQ
jgi:hypothetical protein